MIIIIVYATGGSIDKVYSTKKSDLVVGEPQVGAILGEANPGSAYEVESILREDSLELTVDDRQELITKVQADARHHIIVTHGTDTMIDTAKALSGIGAGLLC